MARQNYSPEIPESQLSVSSDGGRIWHLVRGTVTVTSSGGEIPVNERTTIDGGTARTFGARPFKDIAIGITPTPMSASHKIIDNAYKNRSEVRFRFISPAFEVISFSGTGNTLPSVTIPEIPAGVGNVVIATFTDGTGNNAGDLPVFDGADPFTNVLNQGLAVGTGANRKFYIIEDNARMGDFIDGNPNNSENANVVTQAQEDAQRMLKLSADEEGSDTASVSSERNFTVYKQGLFLRWTARVSNAGNFTASAEDNFTDEYSTQSVGDISEASNWDPNVLLD